MKNKKFYVISFFLLLVPMLVFGGLNVTKRKIVQFPEIPCERNETCNNLVNGNTFITAVSGNGALISIVLNRDADYFISYGTSSGNYDTNTTILLNQNAGTSIEVNLILEENTRYYYRPYGRKSGTVEFYALQEERNFTTRKPDSDSFTFVHFTDSHWYNEYFNQNLERLELYKNTTELIQADHPDFIVDTGDTSPTLGGCYNKAPSQADTDNRYLLTRNSYATELPFPAYFSLGNHESEMSFGEVSATHPTYLMNWSTSSRLKYWTAPTNETYEYGGNDLESYYAFDWGDATFIILDTYRYSSREGGVQEADQWTLGQEQFEWLNETLSTSTKKWKFLFGHHILGGADKISCGYNYGDGGGNYSNTGNETYGQPAINELMKVNNAQFYVYGHVHHFAHDWDESGEVNYILTSSSTQEPCKNQQRMDMYDAEICERGYTKFEINPNNVTFYFINNRDGSTLYEYTVFDD